MKATLALLFALGCNVEPPDLPPLDASHPDAQPPFDGGPKDAGSDAGEMMPRPVRCTTTDDCAPGDRCARPLVATSSISPGTCLSPDRIRSACAEDAECATGEVCTAAGWCAPRAVAIAGNLASGCADHTECVSGETIAAAFTLSLVSSCGKDTDCGPAGLCDESAGACIGCSSNADCPRQLACQDGACVERENCSTDLHCFPANQCMSQRCVRNSTCRTDGGDAVETAVRLEAALYQELGLCGDRAEGWWAFDISGREGARIALTSTRSEATIVMDLFDETGAIVEGARWLWLPGLVAVEVPPPGRDDMGANLKQKLRIRVTSLDHAGRYDLDLQRVTPLCPGDALDQYGDRSPSRALPIEGNASHFAAACPDDVDLLRLDTDRDDQVVLKASFDSASHTDLDLAAYAGTATIARGDSTNTSSEMLDTGRLSEAASMVLEVRAKQAPSGGENYVLDVTRFLGTFFRECRDATDLPLVDGTARVQGDLTAAVDLGAPRCTNDLYAAPRRNDVLYRITPPSAPSLLRAMITPAPGSNSEVTAAILGSCASLDAAFCDSAELPRRALMIERLLETADPIFLLVSSDGNAEDLIFDLDLVIEPIVTPPNDTCAGAIEIVQSGELEVSTYGAQNNVEATGFACNLFDDDARGPDTFYLLRLAGGERAALELAGPLGGLIWIATDCGQMTTTCTTAQTISYANPVAQVALTPGIDSTYFIAVDGFDVDDRGIFDLRTVLDPECLAARDCAGNLRCDDYRCVPIPANDTCAGAEVITLDSAGRATVVASTGAANDNLTLTCLGRSDRDVVYRIDLPVDHSSLTARIVEARFDPALAIRRAQCEASLEEVCNDDVRFFEEPQILLPEVTWVQPPAGTYYVIVDAYAGSGTFTLQIEALQ